MAVDLVELWPDTVALPDGDDEEDGRLAAAVPLPRTSLEADDLLVPNELLLVVVTRLFAEPAVLAVTLLPATILLPSVSTREPLYTSLVG